MTETERQFSTPSNFSRAGENARKFGVHEVSLTVSQQPPNPFDVDCRVQFSVASTGRCVTVGAFYDGERTWRARLYVEETGRWTWESSSSDMPELNGKSGEFHAVDSPLRGMLRLCPENPKQWMTDNGRWFLNVSDTAYLLFNEEEQLWKEYVADAAAVGVTSTRCCSLGGDAWDAEVPEVYETWNTANGEEAAGKTNRAFDFCNSNYPWDPDDVRFLNLGKFQTTDNRLIWTINNYPDLYIQFILFSLKTWGMDDTGEAWKQIPEKVRRYTVSHMMSRWAAFPNLFWLVVNDIHCDEGYPNNQAFIREVGEYVAKDDPWKHLISAGPNRHAVFPFTEPSDLDWVSYVHIESCGALEASEISQYDAYPLHVFLGEDWYEQSRMDKPQFFVFDPQYYYRWLFWSWSLSGGSANYGGRWAKVHPYSRTGSISYVEPLGTVRHEFTDELRGLHSVRHIGEFFDRRIESPALFRPDGTLAVDSDGRKNDGYIKASRRGQEEFIVYHPNAFRAGTGAVRDENATVGITVDLRAPGCMFDAEWYRAADGAVEKAGSIDGGTRTVLRAPWKGADVVLHGRRKA